MTTPCAPVPPYASYLPPLPHVPSTDPTSCIIDLFRIAIAKRLVDALPELSVEKAYGGVDYGKKGVDFTVAFPRFRLSGKVEDAARKVVEQFKPDEYVESVTHDKAFLHFQLNTETLIRQVLTQITDLSSLSSISSSSSSSDPTTSTSIPKSTPIPSPNTPDPLNLSQKKYGTNQYGSGKKVIIEYSSPNIAKSFHIGHMRSTIIGQFLANVYQTCGWNVVRMNYLGDWGTQFGFIAYGFKKYGSQEKLEQDPIKHLFEVYVQINKDANTDPSVRTYAAEWFKRMEDGDEEALKNWRVWRELSVKKYAEEYERLNVRFDVYNGESLVPKERIDEAVETLERMGLVSDADGAKIVRLEQWKLGSGVLKKKDGTSIYLTRDIVSAIDRYEKYKFDKMLYVISTQQDLHCGQFLKILELMQFPWASSCQHVSYGLVLGMSTRSGNVVFLNDIIREAKNVMREQMMKNEEKYKAVEDPEMVSQELGITSVKIQDMAAKRINNYIFDWNRITSFEGDTGPYLQYAYARLVSIGRNNPTLIPLPSPHQLNITTLTISSHARNIVMLLASYPDVVKTALKTHEPSGVVTFAFRLSHAISSAWETVVVKGEREREKAEARLWLYECAREVLGAAMRLLSLKPLERM